MARVYVPAPVEHSIWRVDSVGDAFAMAVIFGMIVLVCFASCVEVMA